MTNIKKIAFFGCKNITESCMQNFLQDIGKIDYLITISPDLGEKNEVAGYMNLCNFAKENNIEVYQAEKYSLDSERDYKWIENKKIDLGFAIGWQRLIPSSILNEIDIGVFGMHGSADNLPKGRGRSPMNWGLILGRKQFYTNLFKYADNIDGGDILDTQQFDINEFDTIETLHFKNMISMNRLIKKNISKIIINKFELKKQNHENATYYPKRNPEDGIIDWNLSTKHIYNLCRAITKPFPGAFSYIDDKIIRIWQLTPFTSSWGYANALSGQIIEIFYNGKFVVKTGDGCVIIHEFVAKDENIIKKDAKFEDKNYREIYGEIEKRYPHFLNDKQKEITLEKMINFFEGL